MNLKIAMLYLVFLAISANIFFFEASFSVKDKIGI